MYARYIKNWFILIFFLEDDQVSQLLLCDFQQITGQHEGENWILGWIARIGKIKSINEVLLNETDGETSSCINQELQDDDVEGVVFDFYDYDEIVYEVPIKSVDT